MMIAFDLKVTVDSCSVKIVWPDVADFLITQSTLLVEVIISPLARSYIVTTLCIGKNIFFFNTVAI